MTVLQAGKDLSTELIKIYNDREAGNIADMVMEKITGFTKPQRLINKQLTLDSAQQKQLKDFTEQLLHSKPVQYVLHEAWFAGMSFYVDEHVLIPRPETEELVETIIARSGNKIYSVLDIGTGSGCIAIALKKKLPLLNVYALDISSKAVKIAKKNAKKNGVIIKLFEADILNIDPLMHFPGFDIIVSNPPYIKQEEANEMSPNVLLYEPHLALFVADNDPLIFYKAIADFALKYLNPISGKLFFEINESLGEQIKSLLEEKGFSEIAVKKDFQKKDRIVSAVLRQNEIK
jgi:release factor glutamine methyltransferase